jgi:type I restriction-modification system DNA methylase subunit
MISKEKAHKKIASLIERFDEQKEFYKRSDYNETLTRRDFIDPFFKALGWDIDNEQGYAESYREVIHEDKIKIGGATKAPDYSFRLGGGKRLFFVEAKKPSVFIKDEIAPAYQVRRYGWSAKLPISIITDFEEFAIYDCTKKPNPADKASHGRIKYLTYQQYLTEFDFIWDTFSKEKVLKGSFDKFVQSDKQKKGTSTVDHEFLTSLDTWRTYLANNIALRNGIGEEELNFVVQHIIDRLIFLRIAEDRSVERYGNLQDSIKSGDYYQNLLKQFHTADQKYNSGLFDFAKDKISGSIAIDNKIIKSIINDLYYPISPYEFSVISVEILGSAYEQFLGKTISVSKGGKAVIEEKPEVRKAGGVYYTPQYIVEYIVKNTLGKLIDGKAPKDISKIKVVDPACGSGSFLIGAYQYLLQHHKDYYTNNGKPSKGSKDNPLTPEGNLTTAEKKRILLNNIYGVDLDANAVEVTKLSLLLKCMEGETEASISSQLKLFHTRVLPTLDGNIKDGNSLIDIDFYASEIDFGEEKKIKPFNWKKAFPEVFKQGGFDCVIGNPPYIQSRADQFNENEKSYYNKSFKTAEYQINTYGIFIEKGMMLLDQKGLLGFIIPNYWLSTKFDKKLRKFIFQENKVEEIVNVYKVFEAAVVDTLLLFLTKETSSNLMTTSVKSIDRNIKSIPERLIAIKNNNWSYIKELIVDSKQDDIVISFQHTLQLNAEKCIKDFFELKFGAKLYEVGKGTPPQKKGDSEKRRYESDSKINENYERLLKGRHIKRYALEWRNTFVEYGNNLAAPRNKYLFEGDRVLLQRIVSKNCLDATFSNETFVCNTDVITLTPKGNINSKFYLGIIGSKLFGSFIKTRNINLDRNVFPKINTKTLEDVPVPDFEKVEKNVVLEMTKLVDQLLNLNEEKLEQTFQSKTDQSQNRIDYCEQRINEIVYELYGLTKEEIKIVEGE